MAKAPMAATKATTLPPAMRVTAALPGTKADGLVVALVVGVFAPVPEAVGPGAVPLPVGNGYGALTVDGVAGVAGAAAEVSKVDGALALTELEVSAGLLPLASQGMVLM